MIRTPSFVAFVLLSFGLAACSPAAAPSGAQSPCADVTCGAGHCVIDSGNAACLCDPGYVADGLTCRALDPCADVSCGAGHCVIDSGNPACLCDPGYVADGLTCRSLDPCSPNPCTEAGRTQCVPNGTRAECHCDAGRIEVNGECIEQTPCSPNPCTQPFQTACEIDGSRHRCLCDPGHAPIGDYCDPEVTWDCSVVHTTGTPDAFEPDECPTNATAIAPSRTPVDGHTIDPAGDADWFVVNASASRLYHFSASSADELVLYADVFAADGLTAIAADHRGNTEIDVPFKSSSGGPVYVRIRALSGSASGAYSLTLTEIEPDDFADDAASARAVGLDALVNGALQFTGDKDVMKLPMIGGTSEQVSIDWNGPGDAVLEILAADGVTVKQRRVGGAPKVITHSTRDESLFIRVSALNPATLDSYAVHTQDLGTDDHGDTTEDATAVTPVTTTITIASERDGDMDVLSTDFVSAHLYRFACTTSAGSAWLSLTLMDDQGTVLTQAQGSSQPTWSYRASASGKVFIEAQAAQSESTTSRFECHLTDAGTDDYGDTTANAAPISTSGTPTTGHLESATDVDVFTFTATANHFYRFSCQVTSTGYSYVSVSLLNSAGGQIARAENLVTAAAPTSGTYYAEVRSYYYDLTSPLNYSCKLEDLGSDDHGGTTTTATPLIVGASPTPGQIGSSTDKDVFSFPVVAPHMYRVTCTPSGSWDMSLRILGPTGAVVATSTSYGGAGTVGFKSTLAGSYYAEVSSSYSYGTFPVAYSCGVEDLGLDDYGDDVTNASPITLGVTGSGGLQYAGDLDVFKLTSTAGHLYRFTCIGVPAAVCTVKVTNASGQQLASGSGSTPLAFEAPAAAGFIYITVGSTDSYYRAEGTYSYSLTDIGVDDHGDSSLAATAVTLPTPPQTAAIDYQGDVDVFSITAVASHIYRMTCTPGTLQECSITVRDAAGSTLASSYGDPVAFQATTAGTYYFEIKSGYSTYVGTYTWQIVDDGTDDYGNTSATSAAITLGTAATGSIQYATDKDVFSFTMVARHIYRATATGQSSLDFNVTVRNQAGTQLGYSSYQAISWNASASGSAYVEVSASFGDFGPYSLLVEDLGLDDHGDTYQTATALQGLGISQAGMLETTSDVDFFSISLSATTSYTVTVTGGSYVDVYVYGTNGTTRFGTSTYSPVSFTTTVAGTYYIRVSTWSSSTSGISYTVRVN